MLSSCSVSNFVTVFSDIEMRIQRWLINSIEPGQTAQILVTKASHFWLQQDKG